MNFLEQHFFFKKTLSGEILISYELEGPGLKYVLEQQILSFRKPPRHVLGHAHTVIQWVP